MIKFEDLRQGHTLKAGKIPHLPKNSRIPLYKAGEPLQVVKTYPAGVRVQNAKGVQADYYFEDGARKLDLTDETKTAIAKEKAFAAAQAAEAGDEPSMGDINEGIQTLFDELKAAQKRIAELEAKLGGAAQQSPKANGNAN